MNDVVEEQREHAKLHATSSHSITNIFTSDLRFWCDTDDRSSRDFMSTAISNRFSQFSMFTFYCRNRTRSTFHGYSKSNLKNKRINEENWRYTVNMNRRLRSLRPVLLLACSSVEAPLFSCHLSQFGSNRFLDAPFHFLIAWYTHLTA